MPTKAKQKSEVQPVVSENGRLTIELDMEQLTWDDMVLIEAWQKAGQGSVGLQDIKDMFDRVVSGGVGQLPFISSMNEIMSAIADEMQEATDPKD